MWPAAGASADSCEGCFPPQWYLLPGRKLLFILRVHPQWVGGLVGEERRQRADMMSCSSAVHNQVGHFQGP